jgi:hypothetical protein
VSRLSPAPPTRTGDVIDAHVHVVTVGLLEEYLGSMEVAPAGFREALARRQYGRKVGVLPETSPAKTAEEFVARLAASGIARSVVMSLAPDNAWIREFLSAANGHVVGAARIDPRRPDAAWLLDREVEAGFRGVKLLPVNMAYRLSDPVCEPFFERLAQHGLPCTIHYGVSVDAGSDLRFADPIDLSPVAKRHPGIPFVIAHFGAGWLDSVLRLAYQCKNVHVDTSGTNNWIDFAMPRTTLAEVFEIAISSLGADRVLFGTDSGTTAPYREWIAFSQRRILEELGASAHDRDLVLRGNAARLFGL